MSNAFFNVPTPKNEPIKGYRTHSPEREALVARLAAMANEQLDIPLIIGGKEIRTGQTANCVMPHNHGHVLAKYHEGNAGHVEMAVKASKQAWSEWSELPWEERAAVFLRAAELLAGPFRQFLNGSTMLGQSKNAFQAEIDASCELIDFFRFNVSFMTEIYKDQPISSGNTWNRSEYRPLEGFIFAITPFNFTSIAANLCAAPAMLGNVVLWKPAPTAVYSGYFCMKLFEAAGLPPGVINFIPGPPSEIGDAALAHPDLAGVHFTGSTATFKHLWRTIGNNIDTYRSYPRLVGETGGKDFIFAHESADAGSLATAITRGAFEFQGQKCSAASRVYMPNNLWAEVREQLIADVNSIKMGDPCDFDTFMGAVIDQRAFDKNKSYIDYAKEASDASIVCGGAYDDRKGYFISPTVIETSNPKFKSMCEEIFGPVVTIHPYNPNNLDEMLAVCDQTSPYGLTGAIFGRDRHVLNKMSKALRHAAGNFYINDKPTGAVVGQQPFGGGRASGTNDKAGSKLNLLKWISARSIKENLNPPTGYLYPYMMD